MKTHDYHEEGFVVIDRGPDDPKYGNIVVVDELSNYQKFYFYSSQFLQLHSLVTRMYDIFQRDSGTWNIASSAKEAEAMRVKANPALDLKGVNKDTLKQLLSMLNS